MEQQFFYNSIRLNSDIHVAGDFLFDAFLALVHLSQDIKSYENKLFDIYYKTAVGIERLQKIIELLAINASDISDLPSSKKNFLYKHSHSGLGKKIEDENATLKINSEERRLLQSLTEYYNDYRYGYYQFGETKRITDMFLEFAKIKSDDEWSIQFVCDIQKSARLFAQILSQLVNKYIELIISKNQYFTTETESYSKFYIIYHYRRNIPRYIYLRELAIKEFLAYIQGYDKRIEFEDPTFFNDYIRQITFGENCSDLVDMVSHYYQEYKELDIEEQTMEWIDNRLSELGYYLEQTE